MRVPELHVPELRVDLLTGTSVLVAPARLLRPHALLTEVPKEPSAARRDANCPFCRGQESQTPPALLVLPAGNRTGDWQVRVVSNLYPAVDQLGDVAAARDDGIPSGSARGKHEVVIECPDHRSSSTGLPDDAWEMILSACWARHSAHASQPGIACSFIFKNHGPAAGASLTHPHSQIMALDFVPPTLRRELDGCQHYRRQTGNCYFCETISSEVADGRRVVDESDGFIVYCPYASRLPYEMCIVPKRHAAGILAISPAERHELARLLRRTLLNLEKLSEQVSFNYLFHSVPFDTTADQHYHWHVEILPRLVRLAGLEWGTGLHINPVAPEQAARQLRSR